jgi:cyclopropane-fatty-acyl-phospholipid synthase
MPSARPTKLLGELVLFVLSKIVKLQRGQLHLVMPGGAERSFVGAESGRLCRIIVRNLLGFVMALPFGSATVGRAYAAGHFDADDLAALAQLQPVPAGRLSLVLRTVRRGMQYLQNLCLLRRSNTRQGAKSNIRAHYDIGNDFYALWLDRGMTYSAALFEDEDRDLEEAQTAKYERALAAIGVPDGGHILEIGCGWGGFAEHAGRAGFRVTAITLSEAQLGYARRRIARSGLADRVAIEFLDYRDVKGSFDGVVSIEMIEAVGEAYWPRFFSTVAQVLRPGNRAVVQTSTLPDQRFSAYRNGTDFVREEIFPGGMLIPQGVLKTTASASGLEVVDVATFGRDYAKTLGLWCAAFDRRHRDVRGLGFDDRFIRAWRLYLLGCQGLFEAGDIDVGQFCLERVLDV